MRIAVTYGPMCLQRSAEETWNDPRTGSEVGWRRIVEELEKLGHDVTDHRGLMNNPDAAIAINEPYRLREFPTAKLRICEFWLNEFSFCREGQYASQDWDDVTDLYFSPSEAHRQKAIGDWGAPRPDKWVVNHLGCDPSERPEGKVPGRVVYCSSPDRGLHRVLEQWPAIRRACPSAHLKIFYRLEKWFRGFDTTPYWPPIERLRTRALYCEEALRRLSGPEWGITVVDSVPHAEVLREMQQAEVLVHPCETTSWSEGYSVTVLDACASGACPVISDCDALGTLWADLDPVPVGQWDRWRDRVIEALTKPEVRAHYNEKAKVYAEARTWRAHAERLDAIIRENIR